MQEQDNESHKIRVIMSARVATMRRCRATTGGGGGAGSSA